MDSNEQETQIKPHKLTLMQEKFIEAYLGVARGIAAEACRVAGYKGDGNVLAVQGNRLLRSAKVRAAIAQKRRENTQETGMDIAWWCEQMLQRYQHCIQVRPDGTGAIDEANARGYAEMIARHLGAYEADNRQRQTQLGMVIM